MWIKTVSFIAVESLKCQSYVQSAFVSLVSLFPLWFVFVFHIWQTSSFQVGVGIVWVSTTNYVVTHLLCISPIWCRWHPVKFICMWMGFPTNNQIFLFRIWDFSEILDLSHHVCVLITPLHLTEDITASHLFLMFLGFRLFGGLIQSCGLYHAHWCSVPNPYS